ncbi:hypothetical protein KPATCC21470_1543 [Kitasatospora purpeofusca]
MGVGRVRDRLTEPLAAGAVGGLVRTTDRRLGAVVDPTGIAGTSTSGGCRRSWSGKSVWPTS